LSKVNWPIKGPRLPRRNGNGPTLRAGSFARKAARILHKSERQIKSRDHAKFQNFEGPRQKGDWHGPRSAQAVGQNARGKPQEWSEV